MQGASYRRDAPREGPTCYRRWHRKELLVRCWASTSSAMATPGR